MEIINKNLLKAKIAECGLNNGVLAQLIGVNRGTISNILNGKTKPSYDVINGMIFTLNLTSEDCFKIFFPVNTIGFEYDNKTAEAC